MANLFWALGCSLLLTAKQATVFLFTIFIWLARYYFSSIKPLWNMLSINWIYFLTNHFICLIISNAWNKLDTMGRIQWCPVLPSSSSHTAPGPALCSAPQAIHLPHSLRQRQAHSSGMQCFPVMEEFGRKEARHYLCFLTQSSLAVT